MDIWNNFWCFPQHQSCNFWRGSAPNHQLMHHLFGPPERGLNEGPQNSQRCRVLDGLTEGKRWLWWFTMIYLFIDSIYSTPYLPIQMVEQRLVVSEILMDPAIFSWTNHNFVSISVSPFSGQKPTTSHYIPFSKGCWHVPCPVQGFSHLVAPIPGPRPVQPWWPQPCQSICHPSPGEGEKSRKLTATWGDVTKNFSVWWGHGLWLSFPVHEGTDRPPCHMVDPKMGYPSPRTVRRKTWYFLCRESQESNPLTSLSQPSDGWVLPSGYD